MDPLSKPLDHETNSVGNAETPLFSSAIFYGVIVSAVVIGTTLVGYLTDWNTQSTSYQILGWLTMLGSGIWYIWHYKMKKNNGYLRYGQGVGLSVLTGLVVGVLTGIFMYIYMSYINPGIIDEMMEQAYENMADQGLSDKQIDQALEMSSVFMSPGAIAIATVFSWTLISLIIGLIVSAIMKRD